MGVRVLNVKLAADVAGYISGMGQAERSTDRVSAAGERLAGSGRKLTAGLTIPMAGLGVTSVRSAIQFESAFTGVQKTVDATAAQMDGLKSSIVAMSKEVPSSREEIASVAEAAGQLGIQTDNIMEFTRVIIDLGNATNLVGQEGASQLARFANITQMSQDQFSNLGSSVVALGNTMATTEAEIVSMSLRLAGAGNVVGLTESQILALAASMSSIGIEAEAGGSAMSTAMLRMQAAVNSGSKELDVFARTAGVSREQFAAMFRDDPVQGINAFVTGLGDVIASGGDANAILADLGFTEIRLRQAFLGMAGAGDLLTQALDTSGKAWAENSALADEAALRYGTTESRLRIMMNSVTDVGRKIGELLIPAVIGIANVVGVAADGVGALVDAFSWLPSPVQAVAGSMLGLAMATGPTLMLMSKILLLLKGGGLVKAMFDLGVVAWKIGPAFVSSALGISAWVTNLKGAVAGMHAATITGQGLGSALMGLGAAVGPQLAVVAALAGVAAALYMAKRAHDEFEARNQSAAQSATSLAEALGLVSGEIKAMNAELDESGNAELTDDGFAKKVSKDLATLRALKAESEELAQGRLMEIAYRLRLEGNSPEEVIKSVRRLADAAGVQIPVELTLTGIEDFENQVKSAIEQARTVGDPSAAGKALGPKAEARLSNIAQIATDAFNTENYAGFFQLMGEMEAELGDNADAVNFLNDRFIDLWDSEKLAEISKNSTTNLRSLVDELSRAQTLSADTRDMFAAIFEATDGMGAEEANAKISELAGTFGAVQTTIGNVTGVLDVARDRIAKLNGEVEPKTAEDFAVALDKMAASLSLSTLDFDAGAAAADAFSQAIERSTLGASRLSAGLQGGNALKSLREGMTGEKAIGDIMSKAAKSTSTASSAVDRLSDSARRADPKMGALQARLDALSAAGDAFSSSIDSSSKLDDHVSSALNLGDAYKEFESTFNRLPKVLNITEMATGKLRPRQVDAIQNMLSLGKAARDYLKTQIEMGRTEGQVSASATAMRTEYERMLRSTGMAEDQVRSYIEAMGLLPEQITTAIKLSGQELARTQLNAYISLLEGRIPPEVATSVVAKLDSGDVAGAASQLADLARRNPALLTVGVDSKSLDSVKEQIDDVKAGLWDLPREFDPLKAMLGEYSDAQSAALDAVLQFGDGVQNYLSRVAHDGNAKEIRDQAYRIRDAFLEQLESFGIVGDAAQEYLDLIGLSDWQIESAITLSGDADAILRIQTLSQLMASDIPPEKMTEIVAYLDEGEYGKVADAMSRLVAPRKAVVEVEARLDATLSRIPGFNMEGPTARRLDRLAGMAPVRGARASGGPIGPGRWLVNEQGPEIIEVDGPGHVYNASDTQRMLAAGVPVGANLMPVGGGTVSLDDRSLRALEAARGGDGIQFGDIHIRSTDPQRSTRELVEKVGSARHLGGRR